MENKYPKICWLTGESTNGDSNFSFKPKKMCINCESCSWNPNTDEYTCENEENKKSALEKFKTAIADANVNGYTVENVDDLKVKPLPIKKPTAKCAKWAISGEVLQSIASELELS